MALPAVAAVFIFGYAPLLGIVIAFQDYSPVRGMWHSEWVGLENFHTAFDSPFFQSTLRNTLILNGLKLLVGFPAAIVLALLLNEVPRDLVQAYRADGHDPPLLHLMGGGRHDVSQPACTGGWAMRSCSTSSACSRSFSPTPPSFAG